MLARGGLVIAIHAVWRPGGGLLLWGEDALRTPERARSARTVPHPFALSTDALVDALPVGSPGSVALSLPTRGGVPVDSPELVREELPEPVRGNVTLREWLVPALEFAADDAFGVLRGLPDGVTVGATVRRLVDFADFAADLVARGR